MENQGVFESIHDGGFSLQGSFGPAVKSVLGGGGTIAQHGGPVLNALAYNLEGLNVPVGGGALTQGAKGLRALSPYAKGLGTAAAITGAVTRLDNSRIASARGDYVRAAYWSTSAYLQGTQFGVGGKFGPIVDTAIAGYSASILNDRLKPFDNYISQLNKILPQQNANWKKHGCE